MYLHCWSNRLATLDVSNNTALEDLWCFSNQLSNLDVSNNTALIQLICSYNRLINLDISKNSSMRWLQCQFNLLTNLDASNNTELVYLNCIFNDFTANALDNLFGTLPPNNADSGRGKYISIYDNPGTRDCNPSIATEKGWSVETTHVIGLENKNQK